jgi:trans-2,3-dihydro-3-hydroxyanthranilate isomerase
MHRIARELGFRDTFFLMPANDPSLLFSSLTFTPHQELAVCGQGMVSGLFALLDDGAIGPGRYTVEIALGERTVWIEEEGEGEGGPAAYAAIGLPTVTPLSVEPPDLARILGREVASGRKRIVDLGRSRLVVETSATALEEARLRPQDVLKLCAELDVTGLVLFARDAKEPGHVRSRVFTRSLKGAEDPTTGGAAAAILGLLRTLQPEAPPVRLQVHQGDFVTRGGLIAARWDADGGQAVAGGKAVKIAEGNLYLELWEVLSSNCAAGRETLDAGRQDVARTLMSAKPKKGGQECPPHEKTMFRRREAAPAPTTLGLLELSRSFPVSSVSP